MNTEMRAKITVERTYRATIGEVWDLWTTKAGFESWWGPQGFRVEVHTLDARHGGELRYDMIADSDEMIAAMRQMGQPISHPTRSTFSVLEHHRRLELTNVIDFIVGVPAYESHIAVEFIVSGDRVRMVVTMDELHDAEFTQMQLAGFTSQLTKLDGRFA